jgi:hypothetical protein
MKLSIKSIFIQAAVIFIAVIITYVITTRKNNTEFLRSYGNSVGYELNWKFRILEESRIKSITVQKIRYSIERDILRMLMEASKISPPIEDLQGVPIGALYKIIEYQKSNGFLCSADNNTDKLVRKLALEYLEKIEPAVSKRIISRKKIFKKMAENLKKQFK